MALGPLSAIDDFIAPACDEPVDILAQDDAIFANVRCQTICSGIVNLATHII